MATKHKGPVDEVRALDAFVKLMRASDALSSRVHRHLAQDDLTISQFGALEALLHLGSMCQKVLGEKLLKTGGNITMVVTNLEKRGLVHRERNPDNRKYVTVHLTDEGRRVIRRVFPRHVATIVQEFDVLPALDQESLARLCRTVGRGDRLAAGS